MKSSRALFLYCYPPLCLGSFLHVGASLINRDVSHKQFSVLNSVLLFCNTVLESEKVGVYSYDFCRPVRNLYGTAYRVNQSIR